VGQSFKIHVEGIKKKRNMFEKETKAKTKVSCNMTHVGGKKNKSKWLLIFKSI